MRKFRKNSSFYLENDPLIVERFGQSDLAEWYQELKGKISFEPLAHSCDYPGCYEQPTVIGVLNPYPQYYVCLYLEGACKVETSPAGIKRPYTKKDYCEKHKDNGGLTFVAYNADVVDNGMSEEDRVAIVASQYC